MWGPFLKMRALLPLLPKILKVLSPFVLYVLNVEATLWHNCINCTVSSANKQMLFQTAAAAKPCLRDCVAALWHAMYFLQATVRSVWSCRV